MKLRWISVLLTLALALSACGDDPAPEVDVPSWAQVAPEQIAEAAKHGVPVAFENELGMRFVLIRAGSFRMGSPEDAEQRSRSKPQHEVTLTRPFYMQVMEVTNEAYRRHRPDHDAEELVRRNPPRISVQSAVSVYPPSYGPELNEPRQPVTCVSWHEAEAFAAWVTRQGEGRVYRLPTEAEWEYGCRAGTTTRTAFGETLTHEQARFGPARRARRPEPSYSTGVAEVGNYSPNAWGLFDMHGNVLEWCADWFQAYTPDLAVDPRGPPEGTDKIIRGGSAGTVAGAIGSARRWRMPPDYRTGWGRIGFRLVSPLPERGERGR